MRSAAPADSVWLPVPSSAVLPTDIGLADNVFQPIHTRYAAPTSLMPCKSAGACAISRPTPNIV